MIRRAGSFLRGNAEYSGCFLSENEIHLSMLFVLSCVKLNCKAHLLIFEREECGHESVQGLSCAQGHRHILEEIWHRCARRHGTGAVLFPADRDHHQYPGDTVSHRLADENRRHGCRHRLYGRRPGDGNERTGHGGRHRLRPALSAPGTLLPDHGRFCIQRARRRRRSSGRSLCRDHRFRVRSSCGRRSCSRS